jgi:hypothetical protein
MKTFAKNHSVGRGVNSGAGLIASCATVALLLAAHQQVAVAAPILSASAHLKDNYYSFVYIPETGENHYETTFEWGCYDSGATGAQSCQGAAAGYGYDVDNYVPFSFNGQLVSYDAVATSDFGVLKAKAEISIPGPLADWEKQFVSGISGQFETFYRSSVSAQADASFRDQWTISGQPDGTPGTLQLSFDISGSETGNANASLWALRESGSYYSDSANLSPGTTQTVEIPFIYGTPLDFSVVLYTEASLYVGSQTGQAVTADYSQTALLSALAVVDGVGNAVPFSLVTASNTALFNELAAPVPLPGAIWLFGCGILGLIGVARGTSRT